MGLANPGNEGWARGTLIAISAFERATGLDRYRHGSTGGLLVSPHRHRSSNIFTTGITPPFLCHQRMPLSFRSKYSRA